MKRPTVLLADDHRLFVAGLERLLESDFDVVGTVNDGITLLAEAERLRPELIVMDISMPFLNGMDAARRLTGLSPDSKLVFLTMHADAALISEAMEAGARAYLLKSDPPEELIATLQAVLRQNTHFPTLSEECDKTHPDAALFPAFLRSKLTARQCEILRLIAQGKTHKEIATQLHMSPKTVEFHKYRMTRLLGLRTTAELTRAAIRAHVVSL